MWAGYPSYRWPCRRRFPVLRELGRALHDLGFEPGLLSPLWTPSTFKAEQAIRAFQRAYNATIRPEPRLPDSGLLDADTIKALAVAVEAPWIFDPRRARA